MPFFSLSCSPSLIPSISPSHSAIVPPFLFCKKILCKFTVAPDSTSRIIIPKSPEGTVATKWKTGKLFHVSTSRAFAEISRLDRNLAGSTRFALGERKTEVPMKGQRHFLRSLRNYNAPKREYTNERMSRDERASLVAKIRIRALSHSQRERSQMYVILSLIHTLTHTYMHIHAHIYTDTHIHMYTRAHLHQEKIRVRIHVRRKVPPNLYICASKKQNKKRKPRGCFLLRGKIPFARGAVLSRIFGSGSVQCQQRRSADDRES